MPRLAEETLVLSIWTPLGVSSVRWDQCHDAEPSPICSWYLYIIVATYRYSTRWERNKKNWSIVLMDSFNHPDWSVLMRGNQW